MTLVADRVQETSTTTGTGTLTLAGASTGFRTFTAAFGNGASVYYVIAGGSEYEIGIGTTGAGTLSRDTVLQSSNAGALVPLSAGLKDVFCAYVAERAVTTSDASTLTNKTIDDYTNNVGANSTHFRVKASGAIAKGSVVKAVGFTPGEQAIEVALVASASDVAIGIAEQVLTSGQFGMAVVIGELFDVNTAGYTINDTIYNNGAGGFTATKPSSGTYQTLGTIVRANTNNGVIAINVVSPLYVEASTSTANTLVLRDGSANFAAGTITAALTGNASTATALQTARAINGVNFDGTAAITVEDATKLPLTGGTLTGQLTGATNVGNVIPFYYNNQAAFPSATTYHGAIAHSHADGKMYQAHGGAWVALANESGNVATATALQTARNINGVSFNGTADVTVTAAASTLSGTTLAAGVTASSLTSVGTLAGLTVTAPIAGSVTGSSASTTGNAATATALQTARNINGVSFNGTANITVTADASTLTSATLASGVTASSLTSVGTLATLTTSGTTSLATAAGALSVRNVAYTFPAAQGAASTMLTNNGSGTLTWATASAPAQTIVTSAANYNITSADAGKQIIYTGSTTTPVLFTGASLAAAMTTGQFVDVANQTTNTITIGGGQVFDTSYSQGNVTSTVRVTAQYSSGKILIGSDSTNRVLRLNYDGSYDSTFTPIQTNGQIYDIALSSDETAIYVGGNFTQITQSSTTYNYAYLVKLNGSTGAFVPAFFPSGYGAITQGVQSVAASGTAVCAAYQGGQRYINFLNSTNGTEVTNVWNGQYGGTDIYAMQSIPTVKAHPTVANAFIVLSNGYILYDSVGDPQYYYPFVFHIHTGGVLNTYSQTNNYNAPRETTNFALITSTHIYWGQQQSMTNVLYRLTIGSFSSGFTSSSVYAGYGNVSTVFRRATDGAFFVGTKANVGENGSLTGIAQYTSTLTASAPFAAFTYNNNGLFGAALSDGSLLLGNVVVPAGNSPLNKTTTTPEFGATIAYPPYIAGQYAQQYPGYTVTTGQTFRGYQTMRLQKMSTGQLLIVQRNTGF